SGVMNLASVDRDDLLAEAAEVRLYGVRLIHFPCFVHPISPWLLPAFLVPSASVPPCYAFSFRCPQLWQPLRQEGSVDADPNIHATSLARDWLWHGFARSRLPRAPRSNHHALRRGRRPGYHHAHARAAAEHAVGKAGPRRQQAGRGEHARDGARGEGGEGWVHAAGGVDAARGGAGGV